MISDEEYNQWLQQSAPTERCLLIRLQSNQGDLCVGWPSFVSQPEDSLANQAWDDVLSGLPEFSSDGSVEVGDMEIVWPNKINELFSLYWRGRHYKMWLGSQSWAMSDFRVVATGIISSVERTGADRLTFNFLSQSSLLENTLHETAQEATETIDINVTNTLPREASSAVNFLPERYRLRVDNIGFDVELLSEESRDD